jgi:hypothetical protein
MKQSPRRNDLPNIFPDLGPVTNQVLFAGFKDYDGSQITDDAWRSECEVLISHGLAGIAYRLVHERTILVPDAVLVKLREAHFNDTMFTTTVVKRSKIGIDSLSSAGIPFVITKGPGIARTLTLTSW